MKLAVPDLVSNSYFPAVAAIDLGGFAAEGLQVDLEVIFPVDAAYRALREGRVDFVAASAHAGLATFPEWDGLRLLCAQGQGMYWFLVLHSDIGARRGQVDAVKGKRIGAAPWVDMGLRHVLSESDIDVDRDGVRIAPVPPAPGAGLNFGLSAVHALEARAVDGFWANGMAAELAVRRGIGTIVLDIRRGDGPSDAFDCTFSALAARQELVQREPQLACGAARAIAAAHRALSDDLTLATRVGRQRFPPEEATLIADLIRRDLPYYDSTISERSVRELNRFVRGAGVLHTEVPYERVVAIECRPYWSTRG